MNLDIFISIASQILIIVLNVGELSPRSILPKYFSLIDALSANSSWVSFFRV